MKYMIAHMVRKEAGHYLKNLSDELSDIFYLDRLSEKIQPHLTLKAAFEASESSIEKLEYLLKDFCASHQPAPITFSGFGHFNRRVVYVDAAPSYEARKLLSELDRSLRSLPWMVFTRTDKGDD